MSTPTNRLSDTEVRNSKPSERPVKLTGGESMVLLIQPNGSTLWRMKYRFGGKEKLLALGTYPDTYLKLAREKRSAARELLSQAIDISAKRKAEKRSGAT